MRTLQYATLALIVCGCRTTTNSSADASQPTQQKAASSSIAVANCSDGSEALTLYMANLKDAEQMKEFSYGTTANFPVEPGENTLRLDICEAGDDLLDIEQVVIRVDRKKPPEVLHKEQITFIKGLNDAVLDDNIANLQIDIKPKDRSDILQIRGWRLKDKDFVTLAPVAAQNKIVLPHLNPDYLDSILVGVLDYGNPFQFGDAAVSEVMLGTAHIKFWTKSENVEADENRVKILKVEIEDTNPKIEPGDRQPFSFTDPESIGKVVKVVNTRSHLDDKIEIALPHAKYRVFIFKDNKNTSYQTQYGKGPWSAVQETKCEEWINFDRKCD
jgi:hypothetical protein